MKRIHEQQDDLELPRGEYGQIEDLKKSIKPYQELWKMTLEIGQNLK